MGRSEIRTMLQIPQAPCEVAMRHVQCLALCTKIPAQFSYRLEKRPLALFVDLAIVNDNRRMTMLTLLV